jgi:signal transduction histidine kinase
MSSSAAFMFAAHRIIVPALVLIGLAFATLTGSVLVRVSDLAGEASRAKREAIARRVVIDATLLAALAAAAAIAAGWAYSRGARRRASDEIDARQALQSAVDARVEAQRREREALSQAELAGRVRDDFLANVSHELRTPLNAIVGWASVLKRGMLSGTDRDRAIAAVDRNATALTRIVNDLLDVSRLIQGRLKLDVSPLDLRDIARAAADTFAPACAAKRLTVALRLDRDRVSVRGDVARLQQVAWHLLSNAVKFTPAGGSIKIEVFRVRARARFSISDSGPGIDATVLPHVFESFRSREVKTTPGLGVGLGIVRQVVELHGGTVEVESPGHGRGAIFTLTLPLAPHTRAAAVQSVVRRARAVDTVM